jgi:hypothetical protein
MSDPPYFVMLMYLCMVVTVIVFLCVDIKDTLREILAVLRSMREAELQNTEAQLRQERSDG